MKARQARQGSGPTDAGNGEGGARAGAARHAQPSRRSSPPNAAQRPDDSNGDSLLSRLLTPVKWLGRKLSDAFQTLVSEGGDLLSDHAGQLRKLGAMLAAGWLAKRLPGPLGSIARWLASGLSGDRGFSFWWLAVTLGIALAVGALVAVLISPVAGVIALLVAGIWMLVRGARNKDDDEQHSGGDDQGPGYDASDDASDDAGSVSERESAAAPASA